MLIIGMCISILTGITVTAMVKQGFPKLSAVDEKFLNFAIATTFLHGAAILLTHLFLRRHNVSWSEFIYGVNGNWRRVVLLGLAAGVLVIPPAQGLKKLSEIVMEYFNTEVTTQPALQVLQVAVPLPQRICFAFSTIFLVPLAEEALFRGVAYRAIRERGYPKTALILSSVLFGVIHMNLGTFAPLTLFAVLLALIYERTGALLAPVAAHSIFNAINFSYFLVSAK